MNLEKLNIETPSLLPLNALRAFECAARHGSVARAAEELGVTSGAVSQQIRLLEEVVGARLLTRAGRGVALTAQGRAAAEMVHDAFLRLREASARLGRHQDPGQIRLGAPGAFAARWLAPRLTAFERAHPDLRVVLVTDPAPDALHRFQLDLDIRFSVAPPSNAQSARLISESLTPTASPDLIARSSTESWRAAVSELPLIHHERASGEPVGPAWRDWLSARGVSRLDALDGDRYARHDHLLDAAVNGRGLALARRALAEADVEAGRLVFLVGAGVTSLGWSYDLIWPEGRGLGGPSRRLRDFLVEEAQPFEAAGV